MTEPRPRKEAALLKKKGIASLRRAVQAFNSYEEEGRVTAVLLHVQHSFEMLLKAGLIHRGIGVFDRDLGRAIGFARCVNLGTEHLNLTAEEAGTLRAIDALRDQEQHWMAEFSEGILYAYCRAAITLFDDLLARAFHERLGAHLPLRVLPLSADPPRDIQLLIDDEYNQIRNLLRPGKRMRADARVRIRTLLAMEAHLVENTVVSNRDVARVERGIHAGKNRDQVFPRLGELGSVISGEGLAVTVRFSKTSGVPVRFVPIDSSEEAAAIREVDLQRKYHWSKPELAKKLNLSLPKCYALRLRLGIEADSRCSHDFVFGSTVHRQYSDNAYRSMQIAMQSLDIDEVWADYRRNVGVSSLS